MRPVSQAWAGGAPRLVSWLLTGLLVSASPAAAEELIQRLDGMVPELARKLDDDRVAGAAIALVDERGPVWSQAFGHADRSRNRRMTADTRFLAGNLTKALTAIAVLQQVAAGHYRLDDPIDRLLPDLPLSFPVTGSRAPTVRELLSHHGGLPTSHLAGSYLDEPAGTVHLPPELPVVQVPGQVFAYSNLGYAVLGRLVAATAGAPYTQVVETRVLSPLGMSGAGFAAAESDALGHTRRRRPEPNLYPRDLSAQGLIASVTDLGRLATWMLTETPEPVLSLALRAEMTRVQNGEVALDADNRQGLAWHFTNTGRHRVQRVYRLSASTIHFRGILIVAPAEQLAVVVLTNGSPGFDFTVEASRQVLDVALQERHGIPPPAGGHGIPETLPPVAGASDDALAPRYSTGLGLMAFSGGPERYDLDFLGRGFSARRREDGWYTLAYRLFGLFDLRFNLLKDVLVRPVELDGHRVLLSWYQGSQFLFGTAIAEDLPPPPTDLAGRYRLQNPDPLSRSLDLEEIRLEVEDGVLLASYRLPVFISLRPRLPLVPLGGGRFRIPGLGTNLGEIVEIDPALKLLRYSGYHFTRAR